MADTPTDPMAAVPRPPRRRPSRARPAESYAPGTKKLIGGPVELNMKMLRMIHLMIHGDEIDGIPLDPFEAGRCVGYRKSAVKHLSVAPAFMRAYELAKAGKPIVKLPSIEDIAREQARLVEDRAARDASDALPSPLAPPAPVIAPAAPAPVIAPAAPAPVLRAPERVILAAKPMPRQDDVFRSAPPIEPPPPPAPALPEPAAVQHGLPAYCDYAAIRSHPSPGFSTRPDARQQPRIVPAAPRRSLRRS